MSSPFYAAGVSGALAERERSAAARTVLVAATVRAALTLLLVVGFIAGGACVLFSSWPLGVQIAVLAVVMVNAVLLRRLCDALHRCASASLRELPAPASETSQ
jgi:hypothetical protein